MNGTHASTEEQFTITFTPLRAKLEAELTEAEQKAWDALACYKFWMFGYWAAMWVHYNRIGDFKRPSPFKTLVTLAREKVKR